MEGSPERESTTSPARHHIKIWIFNLYLMNTLVLRKAVWVGCATLPLKLSLECQSPYCISSGHTLTALPVDSLLFQYPFLFLSYVSPSRNWRLTRSTPCRSCPGPTPNFSVHLILTSSLFCSSPGPTHSFTSLPVASPCSCSPGPSPNIALISSLQCLYCCNLWPLMSRELWLTLHCAKLCSCFGFRQESRDCIEITMLTSLVTYDKIKPIYK